MQRKDLLVAAGVAAALTVGWYQFVWQSQGASATKATAAARSAADSASKLKGQVVALEHTKSDIDGKADLKARLDQAIPASPELSSLTKDLQAMAVKDQVQLTMITTGALSAPVADTAAATTTTVAPKAGSAAAAPAASGPASELLFTLAMNGDYAQILTFVNDLSSLPRLVVVESITLNPTQSADTPGKAVASGVSLSAVVTLHAYTSAKPQTASAAAAAANGPVATPTSTIASSAAGSVTTVGGSNGPTTTAENKGGL